jgi:hypothetical protein
MARETEKLFAGSQFLFLSEEAADLSPTQSKRQGIQSMATQFAKDFKTQSIDFKETKPELSVQEYRISLGIPKLHLNQCTTAKFLPETLAPSLNLDKLLPEFARVSELNIGNVKFLFWPGELSSGVGSEIRKRFENKNWIAPINLTLANDYQGYFLTRDEYRSGGYEACASFYGPQGGSTLAVGVAP